MKKTSLLFAFSLFLLLCFSNLRAQNWNWAVTATGGPPNGGSGNPPLLAADDSGNAFITDQLNGYLLFGPYGIYDTTVHGGIYLIKYNNAGAIKWLVQPTRNYDKGVTQGIATDRNGNVIIGGNFEDSLIFGSYNLFASMGNYACFVTKYDRNGHVIWAEDFIAGEVSCITTDKAGNIYVLGNYYSYPYGIFGSDTLRGGTVYLVKLDPSGNVIWVKSSDNDAPYSITVDPFGNIYQAGWYKGTATFGSYTVTGANSKCNNAYIAKYDANGKIIWVKSSNVPSSLSVAGEYCISSDFSGNVYVSGWYTDTLSWGTFHVVSPDIQGDIFFAKFDSAGTLKWMETSRHTDSNDWYPGPMCIDKNHHIYMPGTGSGWNQGGVKADIEFGTDTLKMNNATSASFIMMFDTAGKPICGSMIGAGGQNELSSACDTTGTYIYFAGALLDTVTIGAQHVGYLFNQGPAGPFVARWQPCTDGGETGISEVKAKSEQVKAYPNPSNGVFTFQSSVVSGKSSVEVYNVLGEKVYSTSLLISNSSFLINLSNQPNGIYLYRVITETGNLVGEGKVMVQR